MASIPESSPQTEEAPQPSVTEARQGVTTRHIRWVLGISLALATVAVIVAWFLVSGRH